MLRIVRAPGHARRARPGASRAERNERPSRRREGDQAARPFSGGAARARRFARSSDHVTVVRRDFRRVRDEVADSSAVALAEIPASLAGETSGRTHPRRSACRTLQQGHQRRRPLLRHQIPQWLHQVRFIERRHRQPRGRDRGDIEQHANPAAQRRGRRKQLGERPIPALQNGQREAAADDLDGDDRPSACAVRCAELL